jgi:FKBP-type peptidyl-prolyl cis-trans isomerase FkpA/FKBP-type peptidyl-prolyl cis-trans isomerase FklB
LQYEVNVQGEGPKPAPDALVKVNYEGSLTDGTVFDSTYERGAGPSQIPLNQVIPGWSEGVQLMPVGSTYTFYIPSELGYGPQGTPGGPIPPYSPLIFKVELVEIVEEAPAEEIPSPETPPLE